MAASQFALTALASLCSEGRVLCSEGRDAWDSSAVDGCWRHGRDLAWARYLGKRRREAGRDDHPAGELAAVFNHELDLIRPGIDAVAERRNDPVTERAHDIRAHKYERARPDYPLPA